VDRAVPDFATLDRATAPAPALRLGAQQPFRIDANRAYGLGIADDKHGVALILHTLATLREMNFRDYGLIAGLINGDEEVSSPGSRSAACWA